MEEIVLTIHLPEKGEDCSAEVMRQTKRLLDICGRGRKTISESWSLLFDVPGEPEEQEIDVTRLCCDENRDWEKDWEWLQQKKCARILADAFYEDEGRWRELDMGISAIIMGHVDYCRLPRDYGERSIVVRIRKALWAQIDQEAFIAAAQEICARLGATYACLDEMAPIGGIYEGMFRKLSEEAERIDIEERLPGIYWCQLVSERMIERTGPIEEAAKLAPCQCAQVLDWNGEKRLWLQITAQMKSATHKKRLAMREYFKESLYPISLARGMLPCVAGWNDYARLPVSLAKAVTREMKLIPLTNDEIEKIKEMSSSL